MKTVISGYFDAFEGGIARGWALNEKDAQTPVTLYVVIDGQQVESLQCDVFRQDLIQNLNHPTGKVGFEYRVPSRFADGKPHEISFRLPTREVLGFFDPTQPGNAREKLRFTIAAYVLRGYVDGLHHGKLRGWAVKQFYDGHSEGACNLRISADGREVALLRADRHRRDVAGVLGCDPNCGFEAAIPPSFSRGRTHTFRFHVVPDAFELENSPLNTRLTDDDLAGRLARLSDQMTGMFREMAEMRKLVDELMPRAGHSLEDYDPWARAYYRALRTRVEGTRDAAAPNPLVSVVIPAYKPLISDFSAAVQSVLDQTYPNWELIIVDDASRSKELTACIAGFCAVDKRIRSVVRRKNGNISEATNTAVEAAKGEWIALFDHDDMLVDVALEVMIRAAQATGAEYLFSDEDKIDQAGYFLEPNFKPDWNHRYMLGCNYACHLSLVKRDRIVEVGGFRTKYNGAQDHDAILRLSEVIPEERIHHVPEILYHWRMTPNSTAVDVGNKNYARDAGIAAVKDHLDRIHRPASVSSINNLTIYQVKWQTGETPSVCVIIPFKEQIAITRRCVEHLRENSGDHPVRIILVDNWSTSDEAAEFTREMGATDNISVLRVEEPFNFSRLNNLAAATTDAEILCFMNNDLLVDPGWLDAALGELADPAVGAVGGRFRYPDGKLQHAGVIVGPNGIAAHGHLGLKHDDYGYIGQIILSREVSAVTAAGMLVRHAVLRPGRRLRRAGLHRRLQRRRPVPAHPRSRPQDHLLRPMDRGTPRVAQPWQRRPPGTREAVLLRDRAHARTLVRPPHLRP